MQRVQDNASPLSTEMVLNAFLSGSANFRYRPDILETQAQPATFTAPLSSFTRQCEAQS